MKDSTFLLLDWIHDSTGEIGTLLEDGFQKPSFKTTESQAYVILISKHFLIILVKYLQTQPLKKWLMNLQLKKIQLTV